jgi:hypothetical protein
LHLLFINQACHLSRSQARKFLIVVPLSHCLALFLESTVYPSSIHHAMCKNTYTHWKFQRNFLAEEMIPTHYLEGLNLGIGCLLEGLEQSVHFKRSYHHFWFSETFLIHIGNKVTLLYRESLSCRILHYKNIDQFLSV